MLTRTQNTQVCSKLAVVIPFYQHEHGILTRAINSICKQDTETSISIIVVDDGSPVKARRELESVVLPLHIELHITEQTNAGPSTARNTGIRFAQDLGVEYIAFLDSDDAWTPDHVARAMGALDAGHDVYLSNWQLLDEDQDAYLQKGLTEKMLEKAPCLENAFECSDLTDIELQYNVAKLSTLVYRLTDRHHIYFRDQFRHASEDKLFCLELAKTKASCLLSTECEVITGSGVNIFGSVQWGTKSALHIYQDQITAANFARRHLCSREDHQAIFKAIETRTMHAAATTILHLLTRFDIQSFGAALSIMRRKPQLLHTILTVLLRKLFKIPTAPAYTIPQ